MASVAFDTDVLIGFLRSDDAHHKEAASWVRTAAESGSSSVICAVNYAELLVGPVRAGTDQLVKDTLRQLRVNVMPVSERMAEEAAWVRAETNLKLPDAFTVATARISESMLASFDDAVNKAHRRLPRS
jgi:predicted nucleic acid-binding protein